MSEAIAIDDGRRYNYCMSERFGIPDHAPQHAPDHAMQNPTAQGSWGQGTSAADEGWPPSQAPASSSGRGSYTPMTFAPRRKSFIVAIVLAMLLGPLGLFYVSFSNGVAALLVVMSLTRWLAFGVVAALGGGVEPMTVVIPIIWCITVPWAVIGVPWRNKKLGS